MRSNVNKRTRIQFDESFLNENILTLLISLHRCKCQQHTFFHLFHFFHLYNFFRHVFENFLCIQIFQFSIDRTFNLRFLFFIINQRSFNLSFRSSLNHLFRVKYTVNDLIKFTINQ